MGKAARIKQTLPIRAYKIDPVAETVTRIEVPRGAPGYELMSEIVGGMIQVCANLGNGDVIIANEEGRMLRGMTSWDIAGLTLYGSAVVIGRRGAGYVDVSAPKDLIEDNVVWGQLHERPVGAAPFRFELL